MKKIGADKLLHPYFSSHINPSSDQLFKINTAATDSDLMTENNLRLAFHRLLNYLNLNQIYEGKIKTKYTL